MVIKPIRSEADYEAALTRMRQLENAEPGTEEFDFLEVLVVLVDDYERKHYPIEKPDPISALQYYMESNGLSRRELEDVLGCASGRVSELLNGKRRLTLGMIRKLHEKLEISAEILIREYAVDEDELNDPVRTSASAQTAVQTKESSAQYKRSDSVVKAG